MRRRQGRAWPKAQPPPERARFLADVIDGLSRPKKSIPCKWLYDQRGSELFEKICELDVYYPTRTELAITREHAGAIADLVGESACLVELGSGSSIKTRILLDSLKSPHAYVPVDISREHLTTTALRLAREYPRVRITPLFADYQQALTLPARSRGSRRTVVYFPGSTIGNFEPDEAVAFLRKLAPLCSPGGGLLIGADFAKDASIIEAAYDDPEGVTAEFNRNLLVRIRDELGGELDPHGFRHRAFYEREPSRVVMQLVSIGRQRIRIGDFASQLEDGEPITTEHSYKYEPDAFKRIAEDAGFSVSRVFSDSRGWFGINWLVQSS